MSLDEEVWTQRLEKCAIASAVLSLFANIGIRSSYNTTVATFAIYSAYTRNGRINAVSAGLIAVSVLIDIVFFSLYGSQFSNAGHELVFGLVMGIFNLFAKVLLLVIHYNLFVEFGGMFGVTFPVANVNGAQYAAPANNNNKFGSDFNSGAAPIASTYQSGPANTGYQGISEGQHPY